MYNFKHAIQSHFKKILSPINDYTGNKRHQFSAKSWGIMIRSFHFVFPTAFFISLLTLPKGICEILLFLLLIFGLLLYLLDGCFVTYIEMALCKDNFTIMDPLLELLDWRINRENRIFISYVTGFPYVLLMFLTYYLRFFIFV